MGKLIDKQVTVINVLKDDNGNTVITPEQQAVIDNFKSQSITEECPACDGDGVCGGDYCDVCNGRRKFTYYTELKIVALSAKEMMQLQFRELKGKELEAFKKKNKKQKFFTGEKSDWDFVPKDIMALSIDSRGKVQYYSGASGIYQMYDDEHTNTNKSHKGGQYWYYGTSLPGLDITDKHKGLDLLVKSEHHTGIFYRPGAEKIVLDFEKPFDWKIFPPACTQLFVAFGAMNIESHELHVSVGSDCMYLRDDNVVWGYGGRNHIDKDFDIDLIRPWIDDGTNAYPIRKDKPAGTENEMNFILKNIPYETMILKIPKDRKKPIAPLQLERLDEKKCARINSYKRRLSDFLTEAQYPFKYKKNAKKLAIERWLMANCNSFVGDYTIGADMKINIDGNIRIQKDGVSKIKHKFGEVTGVFTLLGRDYSSLENLPEKCKGLVISHSEKMKKVSVTKTTVTSGTIKLQFLKNLSDIGKMHDSIKNIKYEFVEMKDVEFDEDSTNLKISYGKAYGEGRRDY
jgi:hypothetical protein